jgi:putative ABC transport system permease protein
MRRGPIASAIGGGLTRRRVQTTVIGLVVLASTAAFTVALGFLVDSSGPFDHVFSAQRGADVAATIDASKVTRAGVAVTARLPEVTAAAGPFAEATVVPAIHGKMGELTLLAPLTVAGRASPGGPVDDLTMISDHWAQGPGEIVLAGAQTGSAAPILPVGSTFSVAGVPGAPRLTIVGLASSVTASAGGWVAPDEVALLRSATEPASEEMLYRFRDAANATAIRNDVTTLEAVLPGGAVVATESYLTVRAEDSSNITPFVPFLAAFGLIGIVLSVLIVANVVSGAVLSGYRRIGILKSIGFTPAQVILAYCGQVSVPAVAGCALGVLGGNLLATPLLSKAGSLYGVGALGVPIWVDLLVAASMCALAALAALVPASRAGRLSAVQAMATGRAPRTGRGFAAHRLLGRLPLPRPVTAGLAAPFAHPSRSAATLLAILLGATTVTFAVGLGTSLQMVTRALAHRSEQVEIDPATQRLTFDGASQRAISLALRSAPAILHSVAEADEEVSVAGVSRSVSLTVFRGDSGWLGYVVVSGRWYSGPGEVDVSSGLLTSTGRAIGDTITLSYDRHPVRARIVGTVLDTANSGASMFTEWPTLSTFDEPLAPTQYDIELRAGTSEMTYAEELANRVGPKYSVVLNGLHSDVGPLVATLIAILTLLIAGVAALGVLNTVVLQTRERVHDLGVFKAVGMTPRQTIAMIVSWVAGVGLTAGAIGVPAGIELHRYVLPAMAAAAGVALPTNFVNVYGWTEMVLLALAGVVIAVAGALLPAIWAASAATATALRAE